MVAINVNPGQDKDIPEWRAKGKYTFPVLLTPANDYARNNYNVSGTPTNMVLDKSGKMIFRHLGYSAGGEVALEAEIRELLGLK